MGILGSLVSAGVKLGPAISAGMPSKYERQWNQDVAADRERLAGGAGGMSPAERNAMQAQVMQQVQAQQRGQNEQMAQAATGDYASGLQTQRLAAAAQGAQSAAQQGLSNVRAQDLQAGAAQRQQNIARMAQSVAWKGQRKAAFNSAMGGENKAGAWANATGGVQSAANQAGAENTGPMAGKVADAAKKILSY